MLESVSAVLLLFYLDYEASIFRFWTQNLMSTTWATKHILAHCSRDRAIPRDLSPILYV